MECSRLAGLVQGGLAVGSCRGAVDILHAQVCLWELCLFENWVGGRTSMLKVVSCNDVPRFGVSVEALKVPMRFHRLVHVWRASAAKDLSQKQ